MLNPMADFDIAVGESAFLVTSMVKGDGPGVASQTDLNFSAAPHMSAFEGDMNIRGENIRFCGRYWE